jgi:hypothetical protein
MAYHVDVDCHKFPPEDNYFHFTTSVLVAE